MKKYIVELTSEERSGLKDIIKAERMAAHQRRHARILLKADQGTEGPAWKDADIANAFSGLKPLSTGSLLDAHHHYAPSPKKILAITAIWHEISASNGKTLPFADIITTPFS